MKNVFCAVAWLMLLVGGIWAGSQLEDFREYLTDAPRADVGGLYITVPVTWRPELDHNDLDVKAVYTSILIRNTCAQLSNQIAALTNQVAALQDPNGGAE